MTQDELKRQVAEAALAYVPRGAVIGVGSGSTVNLFIDALARLEPGVAGAVSSSAASTARLTSRGIRVVDAGDVESLPVCVDGADEIDPAGCMIKGGGADRPQVRRHRRPGAAPRRRRHRQRRLDRRRPRPGDRRSGRARDRDQPVAGSRLRRHLRAAARDRLSAGHCRGRAHSDVLKREPGTCGAKARNLGTPAQSQEGRSVAKPNYSFEKRQRELAKKKKKEQKEKDKADRKLGVPGESDSATGDGGAAAQPPNDPAMGPTGG